MQWRSVLSSSRTRLWLILLVLGLFVTAGLLRFRFAAGDDLSSSYIGCRILASGQPDHLYSYDPLRFSEIGPDPAWHAAARQGQFTGFLHPYVQTPLWALLLAPLCTRTSFAAFNHLFAVLTLLSFAAVVWLVARFWTPRLLHPLSLAAVLLLLWFSVPFQYAMMLMQTHILFVLLTLASLLLAERRRPLLAGLLLAIAAAIKLTPGVLVLYWLLTRRWKAAASMAVCSALLFAITRAAVGPHLMATYLADLHRVAGTLLVEQNNQSFAAWAMGRSFPTDEIFDTQAYPLPNALRLLSTLLVIACALVGGLLDRLVPPPSVSPAPTGALFALVGATIFTPIAWTHYSILLLAPLMLLAERARSLRSLALAACALVIVALTLPPLASDVINGDLGRFALVRSEFYAGLLCLVALAFSAYLQHKRQPNDSGAAVHLRRSGLE